MGNYRFRFPWFYGSITGKRSKSRMTKTQPVATSTSSPTSSSSFSTLHPAAADQRKSYYFTRDLTTVPDRSGTDESLFSPSDTNSQRKSSSKKRTTSLAKKPVRQKREQIIYRPGSKSSSSDMSPQEQFVSNCSGKDTSQSQKQLVNCSYRDVSQEQLVSCTGNDMSRSSEKQFVNGSSKDMSQQQQLSNRSCKDNLSHEQSISCSCENTSQTQNQFVSCSWRDMSNEQYVNCYCKYMSQSQKQCRDMLFSEQNVNSTYEEAYGKVDLPRIITKSAKNESRSGKWVIDGSRRSLSVKIVNDGGVGSPVRKTRRSVRSPRVGNRVKIQGINGGRRNYGYRRSLSESMAVVKTSVDPGRDFKESMVEMIRENKMKSSKDLEELLVYYLCLNSDEYHDLIIKVFKQIWFESTNIKL